MQSLLDNITNNTFLLAALMLLSACSAHQPILTEVETKAKAPRYVYENDGIFGTPPNIIEAKQIFTLSDQQIEDFLDFINAPEQSGIDLHQRVYNYLENSTDQFSYRGKTHIASKALNLDEGNCLSLAILTTALAKLAKIEIRYQLIDSSPVFAKGDDVVERGVHVRSKLFREESAEDHKAGAFHFFGSGLIVDYFPSDTKRFLGNLTKQQFIARYYRNLAIEFLQSKDYSKSYWYTLKSFEFAPTAPDGINLMAVIYKRVGKDQFAEEIYKYGIAISGNKLSLLKNYRYLLEEQNRHAEARKIRNAITSYNDPSPFSWLNLADAALSAGDAKEAYWYYKKAVELAPYLQYGYLGLAKVFFSQGEYDKTEEMLLSAKERNYAHANDGLYAAKLSALAEIQNR